MSIRDRSPRPAELLPPTLLPNAVALAAPHPDRALSLAMACAIYCAMGGAVFESARHVVRAKTPTTVTVEWEMPKAGPVETELPKLPPPPAAAAGVRPPGMTEVKPTMLENVMPIVVPSTFGPDRHDQIAAGTDGPPSPLGIQGVPVNPSPSLPTPAARPAAPLEIRIEQVRVLNQVAPVYPSLAKMVKAQGAVVLRMTIDEQGVPTDVKVVSGPHPLLVNEAVRVARLWRFQPATVDGAAVPATFQLTVNFKLQ